MVNYSECRLISSTVFNTNLSLHLREIKKRKQERSNMTPSLRFEILFRDNFKCQVCGCTASESKLHVDHIVSIKKGGKTEKQNLWTLCEKCNLGKSDRY